MGNLVIIPTYPDFPQTGVECCVLCFERQNCVASAFIASALECELLIRVNGTTVGATDQCPLGIEDYDFGSPDVGGNVYPGPCGD